MVSDDSLQNVRCSLLSRTEPLWEDKLENSGVFTPQIPPFPNNILKIVSVLPSPVISQHGLLGLQQKPKDQRTPPSEEAASQLRSERASGSRNVLPEVLVPEKRLVTTLAFFAV